MAIFEGIGRVGDYAQLRNLRREMKYRIKTGGSLAQAMGAPVQPGKVTSDEAQKMREKSDANREAQIRQKLRQGQKLSPGDKRYLKENNPDLYDKVERIEMRREALERALKNAKSKDEALRAVAQANISVLSEMQKGGGDAPNLSAAGGSSAAGAGASVMTAGGDAAAADALDAPLSEGVEAAPTTGAMQVEIGRDALAAHTYYHVVHGSESFEAKGRFLLERIHYVYIQRGRLPQFSWYCAADSRGGVRRSAGIPLGRCTHRTVCESLAGRRRAR